MAMVATLFTFMAATFSRLRPAAHPESYRMAPTYDSRTVTTTIHEVMANHTLMLL